MRITGLPQPRFQLGRRRRRFQLQVPHSHLELADRPIATTERICRAARQDPVLTRPPAVTPAREPMEVSTASSNAVNRGLGR